MLLEALRLVAAAYLLSVCAAAAFGAHRPLLLYPLHAVYAMSRIVLLVLTLGRVRMTPIARKARYRQARSMRSWRTSLADWRDSRTDNHELDVGDSPQWQAQHAVPATPPSMSAASLPEGMYAPELVESDDVDPVELPVAPPVPNVTTASTPVAATPPQAAPPWPGADADDDAPPSLW